MATLELGSLLDHLDSDQLSELRAALLDASAPPLPADDHAESLIIERGLDDDILTDFFDRLEANDASADIYLPIDFEDVVEIDGYKVGSSHALITVLDGLREDFFIEDDEEEELDDEEGAFDADGFDDDDNSDHFSSDEHGGDMNDDRLQQVWHALHKGAKASINRNVSLFVHT